MYEYYECMTANTGIDIIFPTFNHEKYVAQAIESIINQKTKYQYRIIIGEDKSIDRTREIVLRYYRAYPEKIALVLWKQNVGATKNAYLLEKMSNAKYVTILEGDDYWTDPLKLEKQISFLEQHDDFIGTAHNVRCVDEERKLLHRDYGIYPIQEEHIYGRKQALNFEHVAQTASLVFRNFWKNWNEEQFAAFHQCCANGDFKISIYLGLAGKIYYFRDIMADHRRVFHGDSWTGKTYDKNMLDYSNTVYREVAACMEKICKKTYIFNMPHKAIQEDALERLFLDFTWENLRVYSRIVYENIRYNTRFHK